MIEGEKNGELIAIGNEIYRVVRSGGQFMSNADSAVVERLKNGVTENQALIWRELKEILATDLDSSRVMRSSLRHKVEKLTGFGNYSDEVVFYEAVTRILRAMSNISADYHDGVGGNESRDYRLGSLRREFGVK